MRRSRLYGSFFPDRTPLSRQFRLHEKHDGGVLAHEGAPFSADHRFGGGSVTGHGLTAAPSQRSDAAGNRPPEAVIEHWTLVMKRFCDRYEAASIETARRRIFGFVPPKGSTHPAIESPLRLQFKASAHPHLLTYFMHRAMGEDAAAEAAIKLFFEDLKRQNAQNPSLPEKERVYTNFDTVNPSAVARIVHDAIALLQPKLQPLSAATSLPDAEVTENHIQ